MKTREQIIADYHNEVDDIRAAFFHGEINKQEEGVAIIAARRKRNKLLEEAEPLVRKEKTYRCYQLITRNPDGRSWEGVYGESHKDMKILVDTLSYQHPDKKYFLQKLSKPPFTPCGNLTIQEANSILSDLRALTNFSSRKFPDASKTRYRPV